MTAILAWIRSEPVAVGTAISIIATLAVSLGAKQATVGAIVSAVEALLAVVIRQNVTPSVKLGPKP
jgi:hypothetical protein